MLKPVLSGYPHPRSRSDLRPGYNSRPCHVMSCLNHRSDLSS